MLISLLTYLLVSNALTTRKDKSILYSKITIISLGLTSVLALNNLSVISLDKAIDIFGGLFHVTPFTQSFNIFIFVITAILSAIILIFTSFYPRKVFIKGYTSINILLFYNFIYNKTKISNKMGEQFRIIEYSLIVVPVLKISKKTIQDLTIKKIVFIIAIRICFMFFFTYVMFPLLSLAVVLLHPYVVNTIFYDALCLTMFSIIFNIILIYFCLYLTLEKTLNSVIIGWVTLAFTWLTLNLVSMIPIEIFIIIYPFTPSGFEQEFIILKVNGETGGAGGTSGSSGTGGSGGNTPGNGGGDNLDLLHNDEKQRSRSSSNVSSESYYSDEVRVDDSQLIRDKKLGSFLFDMSLDTNPNSDRTEFDRSSSNPENWNMSKSVRIQRTSQEIEARLIHEYNDRVSKAAQGIPTPDLKTFRLKDLGITSRHPIYGTIKNILYPNLPLGYPSIDKTVVYSPSEGSNILKAIRSAEER